MTQLVNGYTAEQWERAARRLAAEPGTRCDDCLFSSFSCGATCDNWLDEAKARAACTETRLRWAMEVGE